MINPKHLAPTEATALACGVASSTIRGWVLRGWLTQHGTPRRRLYDVGEVHRVAAQHIPPGTRWDDRHLMKYEVDTAAAAAMCNVPPHTIRNWAARGHIQPLRAEGTRTIYDAESVALTARRLGHLPDMRHDESPTCWAPRCGSTTWSDIPVPLCEKHATAVWLHVQDAIRDRFPEPSGPPLPGQSVVYFICSGDLIKIGTTTCLPERLQAIQTSSPDAPEILLVVPGGLTEEKQVHALFREDRVRGEWFRPSQRLIQFIDDRADQDIRHAPHDGLFAW